MEMEECVFFIGKTVLLSYLETGMIYIVLIKQVRWIECQ
ncbi:MAG: hypothetical protein RHS_4377 [Robinsoniella sp. RHS]|nr:MAG: hypothetical protein RHS_4377 [Robinsoniella sp. RHS]